MNDNVHFILLKNYLFITLSIPFPSHRLKGLSVYICILIKVNIFKRIKHTVHASMLLANTYWKVSGNEEMLICLRYMLDDICILLLIMLQPIKKTTHCHAICALHFFLIFSEITNLIKFIYQCSSIDVYIPLNL